MAAAECRVGEEFRLPSGITVEVCETNTPDRFEVLSDVGVQLGFVEHEGDDWIAWPSGTPGNDLRSMGFHWGSRREALQDLVEVAGL